jgi:hypothetical protein
MGTYVEEGRAPCNDIPIWAKPWISDKQPCAYYRLSFYLMQYSAAFDGGMCVRPESGEDTNRKRLAKTFVVQIFDLCFYVGKAWLCLSVQTGDPPVY